MIEIGTQTKLVFQGVDILEVNFRSISASQKDMNINIECTPNVFYPENDNSLFKILMEINLKDDRYFNLNLKAIGNFKLSESITPELKKSFVNINAPAIMFPYIRSFISTLTSNLGNTIMTLTIPTHFFNGDLEEI